MQPIFSQGLLWAPNRDWAELAITEMSMFPHGRYDDITDSCTLALKYLRDCGLAQTDQEAAQVQNDKIVHRGRRAGRLYPC